MAKKYKDAIKEDESNGTASYYHPDEKEALKFLASDSAPAPEQQDLNSHEQDAMAFLNKTPQTPAEPDDSLTLPEMGIKLAEGAGFGMTPYLAGGLGAVGRALGIKGAGNAIKDIDFSGIGSDATLDPKALEAEYDKNYKKEYDLQQGISKKAPLTSLGLNLAGGIATGKMLPTSLLQPLGNVTSELGAATKAQSIIHNIKNAAASGAILGAALPTESPDILDVGALKNRAANAAIGGTMGGVLTGAIEGIPAIADNIKGKAKNLIKNSSFEAGLDAGEKGIIFKTDKYDAMLNDKFDDDLRTIGKAVGAVKDQRSSEVADLAQEYRSSIENLKAQIQGIDEQLAAKTKDLTTANNTDIQRAFSAEKLKLQTKLDDQNNMLSNLIMDNSDLFKKSSSFIQEQLLKAVQKSKVKHESSLAPYANDLPDFWENLLQQNIDKVRGRASEDYKTLGQNLDKVNGALISRYQQDLTKYNGQLPKELFDKYQRLGFNGFDVKDMPVGFNIDAQAPIKKLFDSLNTIKKLPMADDAFAQKVTSLIDDKIKASVLQHAPSEGPIPLDKFKSLLNTSLDNGQETQSVLSRLKDLAAGLGTEDKTVAKKLNDALSAFDNEMRMSQSDTLRGLGQGDIADDILNLNKQYRDFATFRREINQKNAWDRTQNNTDKWAKRMIKDFINSDGYVNNETQQFVDSLINSPNAELKNYGQLLVDLRDKKLKLNQVNPENSEQINKLQTILSTLDSAKTPNVLPERVAGNVIAQKPNVNVQNNMKQIIDNVKIIDKLQREGATPDKIAAAKEELKYALSGKDIVNDLDSLNLSPEFKQQLLQLRDSVVGQKAINAGTHPEQMAISSSLNPNFREELAATEQALKEIENPVAKNILDKLVNLYSKDSADKYTPFNEALQGIVEEGANAKKLKTLGSKRLEYEQFLNELQAEAEAHPELKDVLNQTQDTVKNLIAREENLQGVLSMGSMGLIRSTGGYLGNTLGLMRKAAEPARKLGSGLYQGAKAFGASEEQYAGKNLQSTLEKFKKYKVFNSALKNVQSNMNDFQAMDSVRRAATINSLLQNPDTREAGKQLQEEYLGK